jgi:hypothetical protein
MNTTRHADEQILCRVDELFADRAEIERLEALSEEMSGPDLFAFNKEHITPIVERNWDTRAELVEFPATTMDGFRAKARVVREFGGCSDGYVTGYEDDAVAWSLANDLLGLPSVMKPLEEAGEPKPKMTPAEKAALAQEDPFAAHFGSPPFREQFPFWHRRPETLADFRAQAETDFPMLGVCQDQQRVDMASLESRWREDRDQQDALYLQLQELEGRYNATRLALRGEVIRLGITRARIYGQPPQESERMTEAPPSEEALLLTEIKEKWETGWRPEWWAAAREASDQGRDFTVTVTPSGEPKKG